MPLETTRLSTKGQLILPKAIREARHWDAGTEFAIEETPAGIVLRPLKPSTPTRLEDVVGYFRHKGRPKTLKQMEDAIAKEVRARHARGRY